MERLQKFMAEAGVASRRQSESLIQAGLVRVNGVVVTALGTKIDPLNDQVEYNGEILLPGGEPIYLMLHKPTGVVTTAKDQFGRPCVTDLIKEQRRVYPVGRLDYDTSGLLFLTNDGDLAYRLTHPKHHVDKVYRAVVKGVPRQESLDMLKKGIDIGGFVTSPAVVNLVSSGLDNAAATLEITIHEGKNRQVRKMCAAIGHEVLTLKRIAIGALGLGVLEPGEYRYLTEKEVSYLKSL